MDIQTNSNYGRFMELSQTYGRTTIRDSSRTYGNLFHRIFTDLRMSQNCFENNHGNWS